jgi:hypothetical protein
MERAVRDDRAVEVGARDVASKLSDRYLDTKWAKSVTIALSWR